MRTVLCSLERVCFLLRAIWSSPLMVEYQEASVNATTPSLLLVSGSVLQTAALLEDLRSPAGLSPVLDEGGHADWRCRWQPGDRGRQLLTETGSLPRRVALETVFG